MVIENRGRAGVSWFFNMHWHSIVVIVIPFPLLVKIRPVLRTGDYRYPWSAAKN